MAPGQRKLRDSCDACHIAKVKCIKTNTGECLRCVSSATACSFSPSDRRGKPRGAKNKCNRRPLPDQAHVSGTSVSKPHSRSRSFPKVENTSLSRHDVGRRFDDFSRASEFMVDAWSANIPEGFSLPMELNQQESAMASMMKNDWQTFSPTMFAPDLQSMQPDTSAACMSSPYTDAIMGCSSPFMPQQQLSLQHFSEAPVFEEPAAAPEFELQATMGRCECYPINLQQLYVLHSDAISAAPGNLSPFDVALFINNKAIERCHAMLSCPECVLNHDAQRTSTSMLALSGTMDDILASYSNACVTFLDNAAHDPLIFSSCESSTGSSSSNSPRLETTSGFTSRTESMSSGSSSASSATGMSLHSRAVSSQFGLGTYRVDGEDGRHLKLEIIKIELRKMERLWTAFRDTCAYQKCEDDQKSLYAALVCYLAKKLRSTTELLESRRRPSASGW